VCVEVEEEEEIIESVAGTVVSRTETQAPVPRTPVWRLSEPFISLVCDSI
jgi:hypothetical protein